MGKESFIWQHFTDQFQPWKFDEAVCKHCNETVKYYKKSEQTHPHLCKCVAFLKYCEM